MAIGKLLTVFRRIGGRIIPFRVAVSEGARNSIYHTKKTLNNMQAAYRMFKQARAQPLLRAKFYAPGAPLSPLKKALDQAAFDKHNKAEFMRNVLSHSPKDEFSQFAARKRANKLSGFLDSTHDILMGPKTGPANLTRAEIVSKVRGNVSKSEFLEVIHATDVSKGSFYGDAAEILDPVGTGYPALKTFKKFVKNDGIRIMKEVQRQLPKEARKGAWVDRMINLRAKGVRAIRRDGKIVLQRPKR